MKESTEPRPENSEHFVLHFGKDAYGVTVGTGGYPKIHLLQPFNAWAEEHYNPDNELRTLLVMLERAYQLGYETAQRDVREVIGAAHG